MTKPWITFEEAATRLDEDREIFAMILPHLIDSGQVEQREDGMLSGYDIELLANAAEEEIEL
jgi:hypothetical protein